MREGIVKVVLTGGPGGGKTTALCKLIQWLTQIGYKVVVVSETATEIISNGIVPTEKFNTPFGFQGIIMDYQIQREKTYEMAASAIDFDKIIIICDRGVMDNKAYMENELFEKILDSKGWKADSLRDSYSAVFHLITAAAGAEEFYTLENNAARTESPELARLLDKKIMAAWTGHPHLRIIDNSTDFENKISRVVSEMFRFLGEPVPLEIERKFLIKMPNLAEMINSENCTRVKILQAYLLSEDPKIERRIRQRGNDGSYTYFYTTKKDVSSLTRIETEKMITEKEFLNLLPEADTNMHQIVKDRYCFVYENQYFELDIYPFWADYAILEIELTEENKVVTIPDFIEVVREVTDEVEFRNSSISKRIPVTEGLQN